MKKQTLIIIGILILAVVGIVVYMRSRKTSSTLFSPGTTDIPAEVLREPTADWIGESLTVGGVKYVVVNGQWQRA